MKKMMGASISAGIEKVLRVTLRKSARHHTRGRIGKHRQPGQSTAGHQSVRGPRIIRLPHAYTRHSYIVAAFDTKLSNGDYVESDGRVANENVADFAKGIVSIRPSWQSPLSESDARTTRIRCGRCPRRPLGRNLIFPLDCRALGGAVDCSRPECTPSRRDLRNAVIIS